MVKKPMANEPGRGKTTVKPHRNTSTNASFFYMFLWTLAAIGAITYIALLANHSLPDYLAAVKESEANSLLIASQVEEEEARRDQRVSALNSALSETNSSIKQLNIRYYALESRLNRLDKTVKAAQPQLIPAPEKETGNLDEADLETGALKKEAKKRPLENVLPILKQQADLKQQAKLKQQTRETEKQTATPPVAKKLAMNNKLPAPPAKQLNKTPPANERPTIMRTMFAVSLGQYPDLGKLKSAWQSLSKKHKTALGKLRARYITLVIDNKPVFQLVSGPLSNALDAAKICVYLQDRKTYCRQTIFHGSDI